MARFIALTGLPRSGSTLCCHLVSESEDAVALVEPMDVMALDASDHSHAAAQVQAFFEQSAVSLLARGEAPTVHAAGHVPDNPYGTERTQDGLRARVVTEVGTTHFDKRLSPDFLLMVKHNAAFAALLPALGKRMEVFALMRNPLAVLCSWQTVPIPPQRGHALAAEHFDIALRQELAGKADVLDRQIVLLEWFFSRYRDFVPAGNRFHYEDIVLTAGGALRDRLGLAPPLAIAPLQERNSNKAYQGVDVARLADRLLTVDGAWTPFYPRATIERLSAQMLGGR